MGTCVFCCSGLLAAINRIIIKIITPQKATHVITCCTFVCLSLLAFGDHGYLDSKSLSLLISVSPTTLFIKVANTAVKLARLKAWIPVILPVLINPVKIITVLMKFKITDKRSVFARACRRSKICTKEITKKSPTSTKPVLVLPEKASQLEKPENICKDNNAMKISLNLLLN